MSRVNKKEFKKMRKNLGCSFGLDLYMVGKMAVFTKDASYFLRAIKFILRVYARLYYPFYNVSYYNVSYHPLVLVDIVYLLLESLIIGIVNYYPYEDCIAIFVYNLPLES